MCQSTMIDRFTAEIRSYRPSDFEEYLRLLADAERLDPVGRCVSPSCVLEQLERPNYSPGQDLFIAWNERMAGYADVRPESPLGRVVLDCWVRPEHRRQGLATRLLCAAAARAWSLGAVVMHVDIAEHNPLAANVLSKLSFSPVRQFLELRLDLTRVGGVVRDALLARSGAGVDPSGLTWRYLQPGDEEQLTELQNRAFAENWGYSPNTVEEIAFRTKSGACACEDIMMVYSGNTAIGYCWTGMVCEQGLPSTRRGRILMLGVDPGYTGRGIGRGLVLAGLARLKCKGLSIVELTVDRENDVACALYRSLGFEIQAQTISYERTVRPVLAEPAN